MCEPRFAFAAAHWGSGAVVCLATEHRSGPVVEQQFGLFDTWTQADDFASHLNEGLDLTSHDVQEIVTSSILARSEVLRTIDTRSSFWNLAPVIVAALHIREKNGGDDGTRTRGLCRDRAAF